MRFAGAYLFFPLLAFTAVLPLRSVEGLRRSIDEPAGSVQDIETHIYDGRVDFQLLRPDADESLSFIFEVTPPSKPVPCGNSTLYLNGQPLVQDWGSQGAAAESDRQVAHGDIVSIPAASSLTGQVRLLRVNSSSYCLPSLSGVEQAEQTEYVYELTTVDVLRVADEDSVASFAVLFDQAQRRILGVKRNTRDTLLLVEWASQLAQQHISSPSATEEATNKSSSLTSERLSIEQEVAILQDLQWDLEVLKSTIKDQQARIHLLNIEASKNFKEKLSQCKSVGCYFREIAWKVKNCIRMFLLSLTKNHGAPKSSQLHCLSPSPFAEAKVMMTGRPICGQTSAPPYPAEKIVPSPEKDSKKGDKAAPSDEEHEDPPPQYSEYERPRQGIDDESRRAFEAETKLHTLLFLASLIFCLGCIGIAIKRRCMSPRSRAEWRAQCEERRTAREYRQLARRQAMHNWISRVTPRPFWRQDQRRMYDYEEKRNLIVQQEGVLEEIMQSEIRRLTCNNAHAAEQGQGNPSLPMSQGHAQQLHQHESAVMSRAPSTQGGASSLPGYRHRSYSGRPPSYRSVDPNPVIDVADGFSDYSPGEAASVQGSSLPVTDVTPDSSVREISPRQSSETLRTEATGL